ncbi:class III lanthionine synthetase LanKC [Phytohabitans sp. ZYX-F-186]|uniref:Class III lanthionine synthetase LanKC n=1 Tax=Phytohabitans maris TaxID=3071409 RepID=A0ABU0ZWB2_9ACTN|nr:class III lanthionine synthetase LanKC [Phytohabitans sp. ZYX-F-186]MDQ7911326.1 class III lanthionine synthetase LanKC [Phytohabitans sp. ZYX-F-186]
MLSVHDAEMFSLSDPDYYELPERLADAPTRFRLDGADPPAGWRRRRAEFWTQLRPADDRLPAQGWKIHISAVPEQAEQTLDVAAGICLERRVPFKFLRSRTALLVANAKYARRGSSGKFVTIYPAGEPELGELLAALTAALDGRPGPYILGDLRIGPGPVFVRYGAFTEQWCVRADGRRVRALAGPDGRPVPDDRSPAFRVPAWVQPPEVLRPHLAARSAIGALDLPYRVLKPLSFTNAGGVYLAAHRETGAKVVLREARPHSGLDGTGSDAVARLRHEHRILTALAGLDCVPRLVGLARAWEHEFLVEEYVEGESLHSAALDRNPLRLRTAPPDHFAGYASWVDKVVDAVSRALDALHGRGVSFGDLHAGNVIVRPDGSVALVDFEYAATPGRPADAASRFAADRLALRRLRLALLLPLGELIRLDPAKESTLEAAARERFGDGTGGGSGVPAVPELFGARTPDWTAIRDQLVAGILRSATPDRADRLFPGDPAVFDGQGAAVAHGAAGVLLALHRAGEPLPAEHVEWLVTAADRARRAPAPRLGLLDGLSGVAAVLAELGRYEQALELLAQCRDATPAPGPDLHSGRAGIALTWLHFAAVTGDESLVEDAGRTAARLDALVRDGAAGGLSLPATAGLLRGMSGAALLHLRLHRLTGDEHHLRSCRRALAHELGHCVRLGGDGGRYVRRGSRHLAYLDGGSGGIALVAREYLVHREDPELAGFVRAVRWTCQPPFLREPGLFRGRAGMIATLARLAGADAAAEALPQLRLLGMHAVHRDGALLIPGARLRRFSADLATGAAGVLSAVRAALAGGAFPLPVLFTG